ncbi:MAG: GGDEF domain-containing response regulator [Gemmatimonadota bacterium]|nr:MAG: GGDEF domain-containing response regulator [Gemmatimonadota bacterium]
MTEFEYNLLIIQKDGGVREYLVDLFEGKPPETGDNSGEVVKSQEFEGKIEIQTDESTKKVTRKLYIRTARSALDYILWWECHRQHAVLLDLEIPADQYAQPKKATGMDLLRRIKKVHPHAQVIVFTDRMLQDEAIEAIHNGAFYFIPQPQILGMFVKALVSRIIEMKEAEFVSHLDGLTGLNNKLCFNHLLEEQIVSFGERGEKGERRISPRSLSLMLIDVDDFKAFNDRYLHVDGDNALRAIAEMIKDSFRASDIKGRVGGDEYGVVLPGVGHREALELGERLRKKVRSEPIELETEEQQVPLTVSVGVATYPSPIPSLEKLYKAADKALLFGAKKYGKDVVCGYDDANNICKYTDLQMKLKL